jgi:hypothetical protein
VTRRPANGVEQVGIIEHEHRHRCAVRIGTCCHLDEQPVELCVTGHDDLPIDGREAKAMR